MDGIRLIRLLDVLPITDARNAPDVVPRSIIVTVEDLKAVDQVLFNGIPSPSFVVYSATQLIAEVPETLIDAVVTDIAVLSSAASLTRRSVIEFGLGARVGKLSGVQRLVQAFVRLLMRTSGSNVFHKDMGGNLLVNIGQNISKQTRADIAVSVSLVKRQMIAAQTPYSAIPPAERLLNAEILAFNEDPSSGSVYVTVVLTAHDQRRSGATLVA